METDFKNNVPNMGEGEQELFRRLYKLAERILQQTRSKNVTGTKLVVEGQSVKMTVATAAKLIDMRNVEDIEKFRADTIYHLCVVLDKISQDDSFVQEFKSIFDGHDRVLDRHYTTMKKNKDLSKHILDKRKKGDYRKSRSKYRFRIPRMIKIIGVALDLEKERLKAKEERRNEAIKECSNARKTKKT